MKKRCVHCLSLCLMLSLGLLLTPARAADKPKDYPNKPVTIQLGFGAGGSSDVGVGYLFKKLDFPLAPAILTLILGPLMERSLRESLSMSQGDYTVFFTRPISLFFLVLAAVILATSAWQAWPSAIREESKEAQV